MGASIPNEVKLKDVLVQTGWNCPAAKADVSFNQLIEESATVKASKATATPAAGEVVIGTEVELATETSGATILYTTDGSAPGYGSSVYSEAIAISAATTVKAIVMKNGLLHSDVASFAYTTKVATPEATPEAGEVASGTTVALSCDSASAVIHYTTDGTEPTAESTTYSEAIAITAATTIKAIAVKEGSSNSEVLTAAYTIAE